MNPFWKRGYLKNKSYLLNIAVQYKERADIRVYLEIILSLLTVSLFSIFALKPTLITIAELLQEIESKKSTLSTMNEKIQKLNTAQTLHDSEKRNIDLLKIAVPDTPQPDILARQIEGLSQKHSVSVSNFKIGNALILGSKISKQDSRKEEEQKLTVNADAMNFSIGLNILVDEYDQILSFLNDFENLRRPVVIDSLNIQTSEREGENTLNFSISARVPAMKSTSK